MITATKLENGNLLITLDDKEDIDEIRYERDEHGFWSVVTRLFEQYSCNGSFTPFDAGDANPFVGLTSAPCIAESMDYDDNGKAFIIGDFWYYGNYAITCPVEELIEHGEVEFTLAS